jgi:hypothetical protein
LIIWDGKDNLVVLQGDGLSLDWGTNVKMKVLGVVLMLLWSGIAQAADSVRVLLKDGTLLEGQMIGYDDQNLTISLKQGKAKEIKLTRVKKIFDAATGKAIQLDQQPQAKSAAVDDGKEEVAEEEDTTQAEVQTRPVKGKVSQVNVGIKKSSLLGIDLGMSFPFKLDESSIKKAWQETVPPQATWDSFPGMLTFDMNLWLRPSKYFSVGPFFTYYILGQGQSATLTYHGGTYWIWSGSYWYAYTIPNTDVTFDLGLPAAAYGGAVRLHLPIDDPTVAGSFYLEGDFGRLSLANAYYSVSEDGVLKEMESISGSAPYSRVALGMEAQIDFWSVDLSLGLRQAVVEQMTYEMTQNDLLPATVGQTGVVKLKDGTPVTANFSAIDFMFKFGVRF